MCGVELPNADRSRNYTSGTFGSCGIDKQRIVTSCHKTTTTTQEQFGDLYNTQMLELKIGGAVMSSYKAAPRKVRQYFRTCDEILGKGSGTRV